MDHISVEQARALAERSLKSNPKHDFVISKTSEYEFGWVFFYAPRKYLETGNDKYLVPGANPIVVTREGKLEPLGPSMKETDDAIADYLARWRRSHPAR